MTHTITVDLDECFDHDMDLYRTLRSCATNGSEKMAGCMAAAARCEQVALFASLLRSFVLSHGSHNVVDIGVIG